MHHAWRLEDIHYLVYIIGFWLAGILQWSLVGRASGDGFCIIAGHVTTRKYSLAESRLSAQRIRMHCLMANV